MSNLDPKIRIGRINYTNVWPIYYYFPELMNSSDIDIIEQVPTSLIKQWRPVKSIWGRFLPLPMDNLLRITCFIPDLSVSAYGEVNSILLFP